MSFIEIIKKRWSPRAFSQEPVSLDKVRIVLEAARLAPSSMNEQPWMFFVGIKPDKAWNKMFESLVEFNRLWAVNAPVFIMAAGRNYYTVKDIGYNDAWAYDTGQAVAFMILVAQELGLSTHQMGGFDKQKVSGLFNLPPDAEPLSIIAMGYKADPAVLPASIAALEKGPKSRKSVESFIFGESFGLPFFHNTTD